MKKVLVTGAGGQLGKTLRETAAAFSDIRPYFFGAKELDITVPGQISRVFGELRPDYCINCAAYTRVDDAEQHPQLAMQVNAEGAGNLANACAAEGTFMIHISTDYVFDGEKESGYTIEDAPNPINVYGTSKWMGEQLIKQRLEGYLIVRTSWLYSRKYPPNFYLTILEKARRGETLTVTDQQRGCPTLADNLAYFLWERVREETPRTGIVHFTDGQPMTWYDFAGKILKENNLIRTTKLVKDDKNRSFARRPANSVLLP